MDALIIPRKEWFRSLAEAKKALAQRSQFQTGNGIYKQKEGRHKGQYFVGGYVDFINRY